jgi:hypothetical protein
MAICSAQRRIDVDPRISAFICGLLLLLFVAVFGCQRDENLPAKYGNGPDVDFERSVNGYTVLADMFAKAGHTISTHSDFTPALADAADTIVYAPDDFESPEPETIKWVDDWLKAKPDRTFIYIGRDFDAAPIYWRTILADAPADQRQAISDGLQAAELKVRFDRPTATTKTNGEWFSFDYSPALRTPKELSGPWSDGIDVSKTEIELRGRMDLNDNYYVLLATEDDDIAAKRTILSNADINDDSPTDEAPRSQFIVVTNGSFLVNLQLVNHEHRKLAGKLIAEVKKPGRVVFMDSSYSSVRNSGSDDSDDAASMLDVFGVWPLSVILVHAAVLLAVFCFARWPLFGPPRDPAPAPAADFGRHVDALAEGLQRTGDASYARERWQYYINNTKATSTQHGRQSKRGL